MISAQSCVGDDLERARLIAKPYIAAQAADADVARRIRRANHFLVAELAAVIAATYAVIYLTPWPLAVALIVPWSIAASLVLDNVVHYLNHWPPFRTDGYNIAWRAAGALVFFGVLEIRYHHLDHHRHHALEEAVPDRSAWRYLALEWWSSFSSLVRRPSPLIRDLRQSCPRHYREIVVVRAAQIVIFLGLLIAAPLRTLVLFVPSMLGIGPLCSLLMNITDHFLDEAGHPFRQATWLEPQTNGERFLSAVNHFTAATHLTHHLFPQVHWTHIRELQRDLAPLYVAYGAPRSLIVNSTLLGNVLRMLSVIKMVERMRT